MAIYGVYAKRTQPLFNYETKETMGPDKVFMPLNERGVRTPKNKLTHTFATKEDAQEWIDNHNFKDGVIVEVRKL